MSLERIAELEKLLDPIANDARRKAAYELISLKVAQAENIMAECGRIASQQAVEFNMVVQEDEDWDSSSC